MQQLLTKTREFFDEVLLLELKGKLYTKRSSGEIRDLGSAITAANKSVVAVLLGT